MPIANPYPHPSPNNYKKWQDWAQQEIPTLTRYLQDNYGTAFDLALVESELATLTALVATFELQYALLTASAVGNHTLASGNFRYWQYQLDLASGSGTYTYTLNLSGTDRLVGDSIEVNLINIGNTNVTLTFYDTASSTTLLNLTFTSDFVTRVNMPILLKFHWNGASWDLDFCDV